MKYITDYPRLCPTCQAAVLACAQVIGEGFASDFYVADEEGPANMAYDQAMFCSASGRDCAERRRREALSEAIRRL